MIFAQIGHVVSFLYIIQLLSKQNVMNPAPLFLLIIFTALIGSSCQNDITDPPEELNQILESTHFTYELSEGDWIDTTWQEKYHHWLMDTLDVTLNEKLVYKKYLNRNHLKAHTGKSTNGFAEVGTPTFHTIWYADNHESVHSVVTLTIGHPPALFNEGIAVAHQADYGLYPEFVPTWNGDDFHMLSKTHRHNDLPPLNELLESSSFFNFDQNMTYPVAGSFTRYLIDTYGIDKMKAFISISDFYDAGESVRINFESTYPISVDDSWENWLDFIDEY